MNGEKECNDLDEMIANNNGKQSTGSNNLSSLSERKFKDMRNHAFQRSDSDCDKAPAQRTAAGSVSSAVARSNMSQERSKEKTSATKPPDKISFLRSGKVNEQVRPCIHQVEITTRISELRSFLQIVIKFKTSFFKNS